eukprot:9079142-Alexandrium_andersonii.AAC.1
MLAQASSSSSSELESKSSLMARSDSCLIPVPALAPRSMPILSCVPMERGSSTSSNSHTSSLSPWCSRFWVGSPSSKRRIADSPSRE